MSVRDKYNQDKAQNLIALANDVLADFNGTARLFKYPNPYENPKFKKIRKLERKFKRNYKDKVNTDIGGELQRFSIELQYIPKHLHGLMLVIGWIDSETYTPNKYVKGFYSSSYHNYTTEDLSTKIWHYITVERYIELLFIHNQLQDIYGAVEVINDE